MHEQPIKLKQSTHTASGVGGVMGGAKAAPEVGALTGYWARVQARGQQPEMNAENTKNVILEVKKFQCRRTPCNVFL